MKHVIFFDPDKCCACSACLIACMDQNDIYPEIGGKSYRQVLNMEIPDGRKFSCAYFSTACMHCADAPCVTACPVGCISKDTETGMTVYDSQHCIGCKSCAMACPFGAIQYSAADGKMHKCDGCYMRIRDGRKPACVRACSFGALQCLPEEEYDKLYREKAANWVVRVINVGK